MTPTPRTPAPSVRPVRQPGAAVPLAVWPVGQTPAAGQWADRYLPGSTLVVAAACGRRAIGVDTQVSWARLAVANCEHILAP